MITPIEPIQPFSTHLEAANKKLDNKSFNSESQKAELENLESGVQPENTTQSVNALFDGANGHKIEFENAGSETIIKIMDKDTNEVIRQIPPEELQEMRTKMEELKLQFVDTYA